MKKIKLDIVNENVYYEKLKNGLDVYIMENKNFNTSEAVFGTNFGGLDLEFIPIGEKDYIKVHGGTAHFLEHKLFEKENGLSVSDYFKKSGTYNNAYTNYNYTKYVISAVNDFEDNLIYLLDFVQTPFFSNESVEKERGIILEEAYMGLDDPDRVFFESIKKNIYKTLPYDNRIIGSIEDIKKITKEELYKCYNTFYNPNNMHLLIATNKEAKTIMDLVKENQEKKNFIKHDIVKKEYVEDEEVRVKKEIVKGNINERKVCYSIKVPFSKMESSLTEVLDYNYIYFSSSVGELSDLNLKLKKDKIIKDDIVYNVSIDKTKNETYIIYSFFFITDEEDKVIKLFEEELNKKEFKEEDFNLYKKVLISNINYFFNSNKTIISFMNREYNLFGKIDNNRIKEERELNYERYKEVINKLSVKNNSILVMEKEKL